MSGNSGTGPNHVPKSHELQTHGGGKWDPDFSFSLRGLCDLGVSAVNNGFKYTDRGDAENAEVAQRISN